MPTPRSKPSTPRKRTTAPAAVKGPKIAVAFADGWPIGQRAVFHHDGILWMAFPIPKIQRLLAHGHRAAGAATTGHRLLLDVVAEHPNTYPLVLRTLVVLARATVLPAWAADPKHQPAEGTIQ